MHWLSKVVVARGGDGHEFVVLKEIEDVGFGEAHANFFGNSLFSVGSRHFDPEKP
jgi:hypothetical protein